MEPVSRQYEFSASARGIAWAGIACVYTLQTLFAIAYCETGAVGAAITSALFVAPAIFMGLSKNPYRSIGACLAIIPFLIWAGQVTCVTPDNPGLAYTSVFMFGIPISIAVGLLVGWLVKYENDAL